jgi:hypothetical protein
VRSGDIAGEDYSVCHRRRTLRSFALTGPAQSFTYIDRTFTLVVREITRHTTRYDRPDSRDIGGTIIRISDPGAVDLGHDDHRLAFFDVWWLPTAAIMGPGASPTRTLHVGNDDPLPASASLSIAARAALPHASPT